MSIDCKAVNHMGTTDSMRLENCILEKFIGTLKLYLSPLKDGTYGSTQLKLRKRTCNGQGGLITDSTLFTCLDSSNKKYLHTVGPALNLRVQY